MTDQQVRIGITADTSSAAQGIGKLEQGTNRVAAAMKNFSAQSADAAKHLKAVEGYAARLEKLRGTIGKDYGVGISDRQGASILAGFERARRGTSEHAARLSSFGSFEEWYSGHGAQFSRSRDAARHRDFVMRHASRGTGVYLPAGRGGGGGGMGGTMSRAMGMGEEGFSIGGIAGGALSLGVAGLALAGIGGMMSIAGQGVDLASRRSIGTADLSRRTGVRYAVLAGTDTRGGDRSIGTALAGLGVSAVDGISMASMMASASGTGDIRSLRQSIGFSRNFGLDPNVGASTFGTMARFGAMGGDPPGEKLGAILTAAIDRSRFVGAADEIAKSIADMVATTTRSGLAPANVGGIAGMMSGLMGSGIAGMDPGGAASLMQRANAAVQNPGAPQQNFLFAALSKAYPGISPTQAMALMQGGMSATANSIFHDPNSAMTRLYGGVNNSAPRGDTPVWKTAMAQLRATYGNNPDMLALATGSLFGTKMAGGAAWLSSDLSPVAPGESPMSRYMSTQNQGDATRGSMAGLQDAITGLGTDLLPPLNAIRDGIVGLAARFGITVGGASGGTTGGITGMMRGSGQYDGLFAAAGMKNHVDPTLLKAIGVRESSLRASAINGDAQGIMQLMPAAGAGDMGVANRLDPAQSIGGAAKYMAMLRAQFGDDFTALEHYHAGPNGKIGIADYKYASQVMAIDRGLSPIDVLNMPLPGGPGGASLGMTVSGTAHVVVDVTDRGHTVSSTTVPLTAAITGAPSGGSASVVTH